MADSMIKPVYLKNSDIQPEEGDRITDFELMECVINKIGNDLHCLQLDRNLWRIYTKTTESRSNLIIKGFEIRDLSVSVYDTNPYYAGIQHPKEETLKIRICGVPLSVDESAILEMLEKLGVTLKSKIMFEKSRHPVTRKMTSVLNGTRFMYIQPLEEGKTLPRNATCAGLQCKIFHIGQYKNTRKITCTNCWEEGHFQRDCKGEARCKVCKTAGHVPGDTKCEHYEKQSNVTAFCGSDDILSNFYPCKLSLHGVEHKSSEHAFQYTKAMRCGDLDGAKSIQNASDAITAKRFGDKIKPTEQWRDTCEVAMHEVLENKTVQFPQFREKLRTSKRGTVFVEAAFSGKWGSGLDRKGTLNTKQNAWPGENKTGEIINKIAKTIRKRKKSDQWSKPRQSQSKKKTSSQRNIASMLRDMRNQSESSDLSGYNESDVDSTDEETSNKK